MSNEIDLKKLAEPFPQADIDWRIQSAGKGADGVWARCICYLTNRAIMQRLDDVCGPGNWRNEFHAGPAGGVLCTIYIKVDGEWVGKCDGAENTDIEKVKGGLSGSMKRAAVHWGIGRYLYHLDAYWAQIAHDKAKGAFKSPRNEKKGMPEFYWFPPQLPLDALTAEERDAILADQRKTTPPAPEPSTSSEPRKPTGLTSPGRAVAGIAMQLTSIRHVPAAAAFERIKKQTEARIANGDYSDAEATELKSALQQRAKELGIDRSVDDDAEALAIEMRAATSDFAVDEIYDRACGPESKLSEFGRSLLTAERKLAKERLAAAPKKNGKRTQAQLLETSPNNGA